MLLVTIQKLSKPLSYLNIKHEQKFIIDFAIPTTLAAICYVLVQNSVDFNIAGDKGLIGHINGLLQMLVGFFVASLAAVATFQRPGMDELMQGTPPKLNDRELTRREFISYMFGYLAFVSIITYLFSGVVQLSIPSMKQSLTVEMFDFWSSIGFFGYLIVIFNILVTTLLALFFLTDRIIRSEDQDPEIEEPEIE
ncbi:hypothetical protein ACKVMW_21245 [Vibrio chagasii]|uniref:hypothetical protein n=1 Tax=Vibrio chagasii TaxID=170679 RepID=UPI003DA136D9